ncbi:MAG: DMT family transporter [Bacteroidota bacterium]|nr:DMT family transporter [Bacteroidota bacterium]MDP4237462.1 DMT family transporter [Bacteroidota bacterium]
MPPQSKRTRAVIILVILTCVWGTTFSIVQNAFRDITPLLFAAFRFILSLAIFLAISKDSRRGIRVLFSPKTEKERFFRKQAFIIGSTLGLGYILQFVGLLTTTTSKSAFLTSTTVLWTPIYSKIIGHEQFSMQKVFAVMLSMLGIIFLIHPYPIQDIVIGDVLSLGCALSFGVYILWLDKIHAVANEVSGGEHASVMMISAMQLCIALACILIVMPFTETPHFTVTANSVFAILYTTIFATALSTFIQVMYQKEVSPTSAVLIYTLEPVVAAFIGYLYLSERLNEGEFIGAMIIIVSMIIGQLNFGKKK